MKVTSENGTAGHNGTAGPELDEDVGTAAAVAVGADRAHPSVDMTLVGKRIRKLHDQVCGQRQRVEITRAGCDDICVMISKRELEALEHALSVHAATPAYAELCRGLSQLLADAGLVYRPHGHGEAVAARTFADDCGSAFHV